MQEFHKNDQNIFDRNYLYKKSKSCDLLFEFDLRAVGPTEGWRIIVEVRGRVVFPAEIVPIHFGVCWRRHSSRTAERRVGGSAVCACRRRASKAARDSDEYAGGERRANVCVYVCTVWKSNALSRCREHALLHVPLRDGDVTDGSRDVTSPRAASMCRQSRGSQRDPRESGRDRRRPPQRQRQRAAPPPRAFWDAASARPRYVHADETKTKWLRESPPHCFELIKDMGFFPARHYIKPVIRLFIYVRWCRY